MGSWQLEVARMILYISFPIGIFHYFNQIENIEEMIINERKKFSLNTSKQQHQEFQSFIDKFNADKQMAQLKVLEKQYEDIKGRQLNTT